MALALAWLRRHALLAVAVVFAVHFGVTAYINSDRLSAICAAFADEDTLVTRALPAESPWRQEIDEKRQAIAAICERHFAEHSYPKNPEER